MSIFSFRVDPLRPVLVINCCQSLSLKLSSLLYLFPPFSMADTDAEKEAKKKAEKAAEKERWENSGRKDIPFFGTVSDIGSKEAVGVTPGK